MRLAPAPKAVEVEVEEAEVEVEEAEVVGDAPGEPHSGIMKF